MRSYGIKQRKVTECVPGSETYARPKNDRNMMKCKCAECGITKTKFVKSTAGKHSPFNKVPILGAILPFIFFNIFLFFKYR